MPLPTEYRFTEHDFFTQLGVECPSIPNRIKEEALIRGLYEKPETHISIAVTSNAELLKEHLEDIEAYVALFKSFTWEYELLDEYHLQERHYPATHDRPAHTRRSIIQMVSLPDLVPFYEKLQALVPAPFTLPVPHITLYAWSDYEPMKVQGIGLSSKEDFERYDRGII